MFITTYFDAGFQGVYCGNKKAGMTGFFVLKL